MTAVAGVVPVAPRADGSRLPWGATITGAFVVTLLRPVSWVLGLAGFLAGGGLLLALWPVLVLPTPTGLQNALGSPISSLVFGDPAPGLIALILGGAGVAIALLAAGLLVGAWAEREGIGVALEAAAEEGLGLPTVSLAGAPGAGRVALIRLLALGPVAIALALAWRPVYDAAYRELILPQDLVTPLPIRIAGDVPWLLGAIAAVWLLSDAAAAIGVRRLVLERRPVLGAWLLGWRDLVRRPHRIVPTALVGACLVALLVAPALVAAAIGWERVREILAGDQEPAVVLGAVAIWVAIWLGALVLAGVGSAVRAAAWTLELPRRAAGAPPPG